MIHARRDATVVGPRGNCLIGFGIRSPRLSGREAGALFHGQRRTRILMQTGREMCERLVKTVPVRTQ